MSEPSTPSGLPRLFVDFAVRERVFLAALLACFMVAAFTYDQPAIAMWVGFAFAGYSAVANDSIQTLGTFIASNRDQKWWALWMYIGGIFIATMVFGWVKFGGDISYERLTSKGFDVAPTSFSYLQIVAPLFLLIITRLRMPVSTSILLLSCFATSASGITSVLMKSVGGYVIAFGLSILVWGTLGRWMQRRFTGTPHPAWRIVQFITTGGLWAVWLAQDAANIAVYLPRTLTVGQLIPFLAFIFFGLGILFFQRGEKIQEVVEEKSAVADVRPAAVVDLVYGVILFYKMQASSVPMSTTWVFIGLLGGRELALTWWNTSPGRSMGGAARMVVRDLATVTFGLLMSLGLAVVINDVVRLAWMPSLFDTESAACVRATRSGPNARDASPSLPTVIDPEVEEADFFVQVERRADVLFAEGVDRSYIAFATTGGDVTIFLGRDVPIRLIAPDDSEVALTRTDEPDSCGPLHAGHTAELAVGTYRIEFTHEDEAGSMVVIEQE